MRQHFSCVGDFAALVELTTLDHPQQSDKRAGGGAPVLLGLVGQRPGFAQELIELRASAELIQCDPEQPSSLQVDPS
jgi:hypothetical protein